MSDHPSQPDHSNTANALCIENLTLTFANGLRLLEGADLRIAEGEFVLLVGPSGSGKTTVLRLMAGLDRPEDLDLTLSGRLSVAEAADPSSSPPTIGVVFQQLALFDELSAEANVRFAIDHRPDKGKRDAEEASRRLAQLGVPERTSLAKLSGGERQRVAVARTLAMDPSILLFDEPTTGLDPARTREVADLIADTHRHSKKTVIVVTHDYAPFLTHQPRLVLLDDTTRRFRDVDPGELDAFFQQVKPVPAARLDTHRSSRWRKLLSAWIEPPGRVMLTLMAAPIAPLSGWGHAAWKLRYLWHYLRMMAVGTTALYVALAGAMLGFVTVFFGFSQLPYGEITLPLLTEEFLAATGYSLFRVLVPLLIAILLAGKCGAAIAADLGARRQTHQLDALRSLGVRPSQYLYGNIVLALVIAMPLLTLLAYIAASYASLVAYLATSDNGSVAIFRRNFLATLWPAWRDLPAGIGWVLLKTTLSGILIAALGTAIGSRPKTSSIDISKDVGLTIFWASLAVLGLHALFSFVEF